MREGAVKVLDDDNLEFVVPPDQWQQQRKKLPLLAHTGNLAFTFWGPDIPQCYSCRHRSDSFCLAVVKYAVVTGAITANYSCPFCWEINVDGNCAMFKAKEEKEKAADA